MEDNRANSGYDIADFLRYRDGAMSAQEQHAFEKKCMEDPFVADAYEGYLLLAERNIDTAKHFSSLEEKLNTRVARKTGRIGVIWYYTSAAIIIFGLGLSLIAYFKSDKIAEPAQAVIAIKENTTSEITHQESHVAHESESPQNDVQENKVKRKPQISKPAPDSEHIAAIDQHELLGTDRIANVESEAQSSPVLSSDFQKFGLRRATVAGKQLSITGKVIHNDALVPGVLVTNSGISVVSDQDGQFALPGNPGDSVSLSMIGFAPKKLRVTTTELGTLSLSPDTNLLSEAVVVGYGKRVQRAAEMSSRAHSNSVGAQPKNGWPEYEKYLKENAKTESAEGTVSISFFVLETGALTDFETKGNTGLFEAAIRIVRNGPAWIPASGEGDKYTNRVNLTIHFTKK